jgi:hypothetical protein
MIREEQYHKTVNKLVDAYFRDELRHGDCMRCAVGNLCGGWVGWQFLFVTIKEGKQHYNYMGFDSLIHIEKKAQSLSGYHWKDLAKIEFAFETADKGESDEDYMFNGLMAVVAVLDEIHQNTDPVITTISKNKFVKI